jgi:hypothetical protein
VELALDEGRQLSVALADEPGVAHAANKIGKECALLRCAAGEAGREEEILSWGSPPLSDWRTACTYSSSEYALK